MGKYLLPIYGIKVEGNLRDELLKDEKENRDEEESKLAILHEDWSTLDGFYNEDTLVIGTQIWNRTGDDINFDKWLLEGIDADKMIDALIDAKDRETEYDYKAIILEYTGVSGEMMLHILIMEE
jgi:hypothetical protein